MKRFATLLLLFSILLAACSPVPIKLTPTFAQTTTLTPTATLTPKPRITVTPRKILSPTTTSTATPFPDSSNAFNYILPMCIPVRDKLDEAKQVEDIYDYALETHGVRLNSDGHRLGSAILPNKECIIGMVISDHAGFLIWIDFDGEIRETKFMDHNQ